MKTVSVEKLRETPLNSALKKGEYEVAKSLILDHSTDINQRGVSGITPLIWASVKGYEDLVKVLIDLGADINSRDCENRSALDYTRLHALSNMNVYVRIMNILIENGAEQNAAVSLRVEGN
jgi:ankyrin repeat protein